MKETDNKDIKFKCASRGLLPLGDLEVTIEGAEFEDKDLSIVRPKEDKRYNLKLYDTDIALLDELSAVSGVSRNTLITFVMEIILTRFLQNVETEDAAVLIAGEADKLVGKKVADLNVPWVTKFYQDRVDTAYENTMAYGNPNVAFPPGGEEYMNRLEAQLEKAKAAGDEPRAKKIEQELKESSGHSELFFLVEEKLTKEAK